MHTCKSILSKWQTQIFFEGGRSLMEIRMIALKLRCMPCIKSTLVWATALHVSVNLTCYSPEALPAWPGNPQTWHSMARAATHTQAFALNHWHSSELQNIWNPVYLWYNSMKIFQQVFHNYALTLLYSTVQGRFWFLASNKQQ